MNWVNATPSSKTMFEQFLLEHFGVYASLSSGQQLIAAGVIAIAIPALVLFWSNASAR